MKKNKNIIVPTTEQWEANCNVDSMPEEEPEEPDENAKTAWRDPDVTVEYLTAGTTKE
ncbi:hypothetical protein [Sporosarcina koreensis]|uniref:hypothetical protein n=1 Tax=Sporosarcina koreensis TaxID=334735 RepID=UPI0015CEF78E|nr:hypothetical protein [Sporosarcina koreensis]